MPSLKNRIFPTNRKAEFLKSLAVHIGIAIMFKQIGCLNRCLLSLVLQNSFFSPLPVKITRTIRDILNELLLNYTTAGMIPV